MLRTLTTWQSSAVSIKKTETSARRSNWFSIANEISNAPQINCPRSRENWRFGITDALELWKYYNLESSRCHLHALLTISACIETCTTDCEYLLLIHFMYCNESAFGILNWSMRFCPIRLKDLAIFFQTLRQHFGIEIIVKLVRWARIVLIRKSNTLCTPLYINMLLSSFYYVLDISVYEILSQT